MKDKIKIVLEIGDKSKMKLFNDENKILELFRSVKTNEVCVFNEENAKIFNTIHDENQWRNWIDSSSKAALPPDFFSDEFKQMMDVMRIDDHGYKNKKGKVVNPTYSRESKVEKELEKYFDTDYMFLNVDTGLQTKQDHNYSFYLKNFKNIVGNHISKIESYKENHPDYKVFFFLMDESSAYFDSKVDFSNDHIVLDQLVEGKPHIYFLDENFIEVLRHSEIDYFIWFAPFKRFKSQENIQLPKVCFLNVKNLEIETIKYDSDSMNSVEI